MIKIDCAVLQETTSTAHTFPSVAQTKLKSGLLSLASYPLHVVGSTHVCVFLCPARVRPALVLSVATITPPVFATPVSPDSTAPAVTNCNFSYECQLSDEHPRDSIPNIHCAVCKNETAYVHAAIRVDS